MALRQKVEERIRRKEQEISELKSQIRDAESYLQALQDTLKILPRETENKAAPVDSLKPGSMVYQAMQLLKSHGKPIHVIDILKGLNRPITTRNRISLASSLARYVRNNIIFARPSPNTFALLTTTTPKPPENFGLPPEEEIEN